MLIAQSGTSFICAPIFGYLVDRTGKTKALYLIGLIMLMASMILFAGAKSLQLFIIARIPQGAAVAMVYVAGLTLLIESVPKDKLGYLFGCLDISLAFGIIAGPLFGGIVYSFAGYHAVFWAALMLLTIDLVLRLAVISRSSAAQWLKMPVSEHPSGVEAIEDVGYGSIFAEETDQSCHQPREELSILSLHREPRVVISVVAMLVFSLLLAAFDNVSAYVSAYLVCY
jgi:MFS family permease